MAGRTLEYEVFRNPKSGLFGYRVRYLGAPRFHHEVGGCRTIEQAQRMVDPYGQRCWAVTKTAEGSSVLVCHDFLVVHGADVLAHCTKTVASDSKKNFATKARILEALAIQPRTSKALSKALGVPVHTIACHLWRLRGREVHRLESGHYIRYQTKPV